MMNFNRREFCKTLGLGTAGLLLNLPFSLSTCQRKSRKDLAKDNELTIKVIGLGGLGTRCLDQMIQMGLKDIEFTVMNADKFSLVQSLCPSKIHLGESSTKGNGCGMNPELGYAYTLNSQETITTILRGSNIVFIVAGMGGGTGTGGAPVVARIARDLGAVPIGVVTMPFSFEGKWRLRNAQEGLQKLKEASDLIIMVPNDFVINFFPPQVLLIDVLNKSIDIISSSVKNLLDFFLASASGCLYFSDVKNLFSRLGLAYAGIGSDPEKSILRAVQTATDYPLLKDVPLSRARKVICILRVSSQERLANVQYASEIVVKKFPRDTDFIFHVSVDKSDRTEAVLFISGFAWEQSVS